MCGVLATWLKTTADVEKSIARLRHRGPDDQGIFRDASSGVCLGHTRLSILDLSEQGHQPMTTLDGKVTIVFNGEIYNFQELKLELRNAGYKFRSSSDTEVLLNLYCLYGIEMLEKIKGIFVFVVWDSQVQELFVARDEFGVKPLYYSESPNGLMLSSEVKSLVQLVSERGELDVAALHRYMTFAWCPGNSIPVKSIRKLGPGEAMRVRNGRLYKRWQWYQLPMFQSSPEQVGLAECSNEVRRRLEEAVQRQLVADVPVGAFLSGGLDSSCIVAMAKQRAADIHCFTIDIQGGPDMGSQNDLPYAKTAASHLGVPLDVVGVNSSQIAADIEKMVYMLDEPQADPAALNVLYISRLAHQQGIKVLLSGVGADDLFSGYRRHMAIKAEKFLSLLPRQFSELLYKTSDYLDSRKVWSRRIKQLLSNASDDPNVRLANYYCQVNEKELFPLYSTEFLHALNSESAVQPMLDFIGTMPNKSTNLQKMLAMDQRFFLSDHNLNYTDKMSMAAGVEVRVPFLDRDFVEYVSMIPDHFKQRNLTSKWILRHAMKDYLPKEIVMRPKTGFGLPVRRWLRNELREMLFDYLSPISLRNRGLFNVDAVQELIKRNESGEIDGAYPLLAMLCIEIWCRQTIDGVADYNNIYAYNA